MSVASESRKLNVTVSEKSYLKLGIKALVEGRSVSSVVEDLCETLEDYEIRQCGKSIGRSPKGDGRIYFIQNPSSNLIKIGYSKNPAQRIKELQTGSPDSFTLLGTVPGGKAEERALHQRFAGLRGAGEWFRPGKELKDYIAAATAAGEGS